MHNVVGNGYILIRSSLKDLKTSELLKIMPNVVICDAFQNLCRRHWRHLGPIVDTSNQTNHTRRFHYAHANPQNLEVLNIFNDNAI